MRSTGQRGLVKRYTCLGIIECASCKSTIRPKTQKAARLAQLDSICPGMSIGKCTDSQLRLKHCPAYTLQYPAKRESDSAEIIVWEHFGEHRQYHSRPPGAPLSREEEQLLARQVALRPEASTHELRKGSHIPGSVPLAEINPTMADPAKARYRHNKARQELGLEGSKSGKGNL